MTLRSVTIVGASLAGLRTAEALRREGFDGVVTLIGDEPHLPYDRPPLSKQVLAGAWTVERAALTSSSALIEKSIDIRLSTRAIAFDLAQRVLSLDDGMTLSVDGLVIATGSRCRRLAGTEHLDGVHVLRGIDDVVALRSDLAATPSRVVVVGAGFIGSEVAATIRGMDIDVSLVEPASAPLVRVVGDQIGEVCAGIHRDHGVDLRTGVGVESVQGGKRVESVVLTDGSTIKADVVVVGIGVQPNVEWLSDSGLEIDEG